MRIAPKFDQEQIKVIDQVEGFGKNRTEKIKNIVLSWLSEHHYFNKK